MAIKEQMKPINADFNEDSFRQDIYTVSEIKEKVTSDKNNKKSDKKPAKRKSLMVVNENFGDIKV